MEDLSCTELSMHKIGSGGGGLKKGIKVSTFVREYGPEKDLRWERCGVT